ADLGQAGSRLGPVDPLLQRTAEQHRDAARHAVAPHRHYPPRPDLVQVGLHPERAFRAAEIPRAAGADAAVVPYNNLMFAGVGYLIEMQSGKTWEQFVRERILQPLEMKSTGYTIAEMVKAPEHGVGFTERRDTFELYETPYYEDIEGVAPCGAIVSNIDD